MSHSYKKSLVLLSVVSAALFGCGTVHKDISELENNITEKVAMEQKKADKPTPVISTTPLAFVKGQEFQVMPLPSPLLATRIAYAPTQKVSLSDIAAFVSSKTGLLVDVSEVMAPVAAPANNQMSGSNAQNPNNNPSPFASIIGIGGMPNGGVSGTANNVTSFTIAYQGDVSGLLDISANKVGVWWAFREGKAVFFRTETKTFYLNSLARVSTIKNGISSGGVSNSSSSTTGGGGSSNSGSSGTTGTNITSDTTVDEWKDFKEQAQVVAGSGRISVNPSAGSITVTGTPTQVRNVEQWTKEQNEKSSQNVVITVETFNTKLSKEDNYSFNPTVGFSQLAARYGAKLTGPQAPAVVGGETPFNVTANVLSSANGTAGQFKSSSLAFQALSTLGDTVQTMRQSVVTINGQPASMQIGNQQVYLAQLTQGTSTTTGTVTGPSLTPGTNTTGFTAVFTPRVNNGKIFVSMNIDSTIFINMATLASGGSSIQGPNNDVNKFLQSVALLPGDSLLLTGMSKANGTKNNTGVGSPNNYLFGGGVDNNTDRQMIAIVITARLM